MSFEGSGNISLMKRFILDEKVEIHAYQLVE